ncbi:MAG TPA: DUF1800 domain-containing protein [Candidatus Limnocylindrales bacterium]|nr:DUF1800 domain-containing protein [Candidatus Limnocylindrales bacterium]
MESPAPDAPSHGTALASSGKPPLWKRPVTRRAALAGGATAAAGVALAALWRSGDLTQILQHVQDLAHGYQNPFTTDRVRVAHLLRRAGFGATAQDLDHYAAMGTTAATEAVLGYSAVSNQVLETELPPIDPAALRNGAGNLRLQAWWLQRMAATARPLEEKMTLFWHGLLTSGLDKSGPGQLYLQNQLYRAHALGNFDDLLKAVTRDPAMMVYLDTETNRVGKPNENYARELMELFTTGIGHYSETDVRESARAFTGWTLGRGNVRYPLQSTFVPRLHDAGMKTFMGKTGAFTGDDIIEMLVPLRATAERLSTKLFTFFAYPNPEPAIVQHLADTFQQKRYNVGAVVRAILTMDAFYSPKAYRAAAKSPAEYVAQMIRTTGALAAGPAAGASGSGSVTSAQATGLNAAVAAMGAMGQVLFYPPNVAGWPGGSTWINSSALMNRLNFANALARRVGPAFAGKTLDGMLATYLDGNVTDATKAGLQQLAAAHGSNPATLLYFVLATPEYQLN